MLPELIVKKVTSLPTTIVPYMGTYSKKSNISAYHNSPLYGYR